MADVTRGRPLSPHLSIYRRTLTMMMSITHRVTGVGLGVSAVLIVWWFLSAARGPERFAFADWLLTSWVGGLVLIASVLALWYHFFNGIRHLIWDAGAGLEVDKLRGNNIAVLAAAGVMSVVTLFVGWM
jgi:succinate dehydrogenase / fumarate reductase, cytochrome b subunit